MFDECKKKQEEIKTLFSKCTSEEEVYHKIIEIGKHSAALPDEHKTEENIVSGCQSVMYLRSYMNNGKIYFEADSEAMISSGLAVLLTMVYSGEDPETVLKCPPDYLEQLGISTSLTPNRANGLASIHLKMRQDALKFLVNQ